VFSRLPGRRSVLLRPDRFTPSFISLAPQGLLSWKLGPTVPFFPLDPHTSLFLYDEDIRLEHFDCLQRIKPPSPTNPSGPPLFLLYPFFFILRVKERSPPRENREEEDPPVCLREIPKRIFFFSPGRCRERLPEAASEKAPLIVLHLFFPRRPLKNLSTP